MLDSNSCLKDSEQQDSRYTVRVLLNRDRSFITWVGQVT